MSLVPKKGLSNVTNLVFANKSRKPGLGKTSQQAVATKRKSADTDQENDVCQTETISLKIEQIQISCKKTKVTKVEPLESLESRYLKIRPPPPPAVFDYDATQLRVMESAAFHAQDVFTYLMEREKTFRVQKYMHTQNQISPKKRAILVDWLVELQQQFNLNHETLYLAIKIMDHFLMEKCITTANIQLLGMTCLFIAAKFDVSCSCFAFLFIYF